MPAAAPGEAFCLSGKRSCPFARASSPCVTATGISWNSLTPHIFQGKSRTERQPTRPRPGLSPLLRPPRLLPQARKLPAGLMPRLRPRRNLCRGPRPPRSQQPRPYPGRAREQPVRSKRLLTARQAGLLTIRPRRKKNRLPRRAFQARRERPLWTPWPRPRDTRPP